MEVIQGKHSRQVDAAALAVRAGSYDDILLDVGTGDGRFVQAVARACPTTFAIGVDACRENVRKASRDGLPNALYVIANALALPVELCGLANHVTINFPWGSLLEGLIEGAPSLLDGLRTAMRPGAVLEVRLNAGALAEAGWSLEQGGAAVHRTLRTAGFSVGSPRLLDAAALRACPTSWAKRLAFGRDPRALYLRAAPTLNRRANETKPPAEAERAHRHSLVSPR
jgi:16S rRNA (adenine(1408)-N(1))-methyltransferase